MEFFKNTNIDFLGKKWYFLAFSLVFSVAGLLSLFFVHHLPLGIDFRGGTLVYVQSQQTPNIDNIRTSLERSGVNNATIQSYGAASNNEVLIKLDRSNSENALDAGKFAITNALEKDFPGLHVGKAIAKMGVWALPTSELALDDCFVPDSHRLSREEGDGETHLRKLLAEIRIVTGALALGGASGALEEAIRYARERQQFGKPINRYQAIQLKLAEMGTELEAARRLVHYAAWLKDNDKPHHKEAAMAKLFASEAAVQICDKAARVMASYGYSMEYAVQRHLRDIRFTLIGGGTSEILKLIIAKELSG